MAGGQRPHPGAELRIADLDGMRITAFVTNTSQGQPPARLRPRGRDRVDDR